jgi:hypothetical protein
MGFCGYECGEARCNETDETIGIFRGCELQLSELGFMTR